MVLSDKFAGKPRPGLVKKTLLYVVSFGLGSLVVVGLLGWGAVNVAEGVFPGAQKPKARATATDGADEGDEAPAGMASADASPGANRPASRTPRRRPGSKAPRPRVNETAPE